LDKEVSSLIITLTIVLELDASKESWIHCGELTALLSLAIGVKILLYGILVEHLAAIFVQVLFLVPQASINSWRVEWSHTESIASIHNIGDFSIWACQSQSFLIERNRGTLNA
jgi:hypothetical protein